jgi:hypothetical protein
MVYIATVIEMGDPLVKTSWTLWECKETKIGLACGYVHLFSGVLELVLLGILRVETMWAERVVWDCELINAWQKPIKGNDSS